LAATSVIGAGVSLLRPRDEGVPGEVQRVDRASPGQSVTPSSVGSAAAFEEAIREEVEALP
jgi:hypothetical protein